VPAAQQPGPIQPTVICTLGNFSTKLLRADNTGISRLHGQAEVRTIGARAIRLYPLYHPAAALYTPSTLEVLRADFHRIPELLALGAPEQPEAPEPPEQPVEPELEDREEIPEPEEPVEEPDADLTADDEDLAAAAAPEPRTVQLGLF
jgi:uracil-DNA glycosylase